MNGFIPYVNTIATFLTRRCYEQVAIDVCLHALPVRLLGNGGGAVYAPLGPTHMALEDIGIMRALPGMTIVCPADAQEMTRAVEATLNWPDPVYLRFGKGGDPIVSSAEHGFAIGEGITMRAGSDVGIISTGIMTSRALAAAELLAAAGIDPSVLHIHTIKPLDERAVRELARTHELVVTIEEHSRVGGLGSAVSDVLAEADIITPQLRLAFPDAFSSTYGSQDSQLQSVGLQPNQLAEQIRRKLETRVSDRRRVVKTYA
jgi:transketolase